MTNLWEAARGLVRKSGFDIVRYPPQSRDPFEDMAFFLANTERPTVFDVGANVGQSVKKFRHSMPECVIHSFEPSPRTYGRLRETCAGIQGVSTWNCGVGATNGQMPLLENVESDMTSVLEPSEFAWGHADKTTMVDLVTLDDFSAKNGIDYIHILKSDTQGYEFEVFSGARRLMAENKIGLIYFEVIFSDMYKGTRPFDEILKLLFEHGFLLVSFYTPHFQKNLLSWTDVLFINSRYYAKVAKNA